MTQLFRVFKIKDVSLLLEYRWYIFEICALGKHLNRVRFRKPITDLTSDVPVRIKTTKLNNTILLQ